MTLIASLGILIMLYFTNKRGLSDSAAAAIMLLLLGVIVSSLFDVLNRRMLGFMSVALLVSILVPLPAVLIFGQNIARELSVWSCLMFVMLCLPVLCTPLTIRWQRVQG
jgi:drug/metabolite transporter (DMT)-like permease